MADYVWCLLDKAAEHQQVNVKREWYIGLLAGTASLKSVKYSDRITVHKTEYKADKYGFVCGGSVMPVNMFSVSVLGIQEGWLSLVSQYTRLFPGRRVALRHFLF